MLEVLKILEKEINLRDDTRVAEQARRALENEQYLTEARKLAERQDKLRSRIEEVVGRIRELPDGDRTFAPELRLLDMVGVVMDEAVEILARPETGAPAIAVETEVIELLLQSRRINPGGGGGGSSPGGGGGGTTTDSALALLGKGLNEKEVREDHGISQSTGHADPSLPEEFRAGLDEYFKQLESPR